jgi:hypothetical protein
MISSDYLLIINEIWSQIPLNLLAAMPVAGKSHENKTHFSHNNDKQDSFLWRPPGESGCLHAINLHAILTHPLFLPGSLFFQMAGPQALQQLPLRTACCSQHQW